MTKLTTSTVIKTTDGRPFDTRKEAVAHQQIIDRTARILAVLDADETAQVDISGANDLSEIASTLARLGVELLEALTLPSGRKPRTPKAAA